MIMNDDIGEMEPADSLDEESSSCSSNDGPSSQYEVDSISNTDSEFHGRRILIEKGSVRNRPSKPAKTRGGISNHGRTIRTRGGISNNGRTTRTRGGISNHGRRTARIRGGIQNCRTRDAAHTSHLQLNETMDNNAVSNEQHNDIIDESTNSSKQQQHVSVSMDDGNVDKSNVDISISERLAIVEGIGSNSRGGNETNNNTWSKDSPVIKIFTFSENTGLKIVVPENDNPLFYFKPLVLDELLGRIVQRSNEYALRVIGSTRPPRCKSVLNKWKELTLSKMKKFFGLVFHMGLVGMPWTDFYMITASVTKELNKPH